MGSNVIKIGEKIRLTKIQEEQGNRKTKADRQDILSFSYVQAEKDRIYYSRVIQILEQNKIRVAMPMVNGKYVVLGFLDKYKIEFFTKKGIYKCDGKVVSRFKDTRAYYLVFELLTEFEKLQRREYYRLDCLLATKFKRSMEGDIYKKDSGSEPEADQEQKKNIWHPALITNISGGGAKFNSSEKVNIGEMILLKLHLTYDNGVKDFEFPAEVVSSRKVENKSDIFETRVQYANISVREREEIVRFVFDEERRIRKRKKGLV